MEHGWNDDIEICNISINALNIEKKFNLKINFKTNTMTRQLKILLK
jgi:hypothetical protein